MTLVGTALNAGEKMKIYPEVLTSFIKPQTWLFHVVGLLSFAADGKEMDRFEVKNALAGHAKLLILSVVVVVA